MPQITRVASRHDIPPRILPSPVGLLLEYHNLNRPFDNHGSAQLLIGMCMDNRKRLRIPDNFAFIIRSGGANLKPLEFNVSYAIAIGRVRSLALITHTHCGMVNLKDREALFVQGLVDAGGWTRDSAEGHYSRLAPDHEIGDEITFAIEESTRLSRTYPGIDVVPLLYRVEDNLLCLIQD